MPDRTLWWDHPTTSLRFVNQTLLPARYEIIRCGDVSRLEQAIRTLEIRGAPALGVAGAYGIALAALNSTAPSHGQFISDVEGSAFSLKRTRPTAVNLSWGVDRVLERVRTSPTISEGRVAALEEAERIAKEDIAICHALGEAGAALLPQRCTVLTHCNAGALACTEWGTALGVIRSAVEKGKDVQVIASETRPLFQGARLTAWELERDGIGVTVIPDSAAAFLMQRGEIDLVMVGADRVTRTIVYNKIGTYMHAVTAMQHHIPFYVAAPLSTFDLHSRSDEVVIEERGREELAWCGDREILPHGVPVRSYAFDATPLTFVTALITERGVLYPPFTFENMLPPQPPL